MNVQQIFPSFVAVENISSLVDNSAIELFCYQHEVGTLDLTSDGISPLVKVINERLHGIKDMYGLRHDVDVKVVNGWININRPSNVVLPNNPPHLHANYFVSAVYYVKTPPNCGDLTFIAPFTGLEYTVPRNAISNDTIYNASRWSVNPEAGKLIIFPSWLLHYVNSNYSNNDRISIAFNIGGLAQLGEQ